MSVTSTDTGKVVYVLGAGFSFPAGAPTQAQLLGDILSLNLGTDRFEQSIARLREFLKDLGLDPDDSSNVALEDLYTPIDRCIADGTAFRSRPPADLERIRVDIGYLISVAISRRITRHQTSEPHAGRYIDEFARHLVDKAAKRADLARDTADSRPAKNYDPLSIISLNWDILLDNALHRALWERDPGMTGDYDPFGVVDYCCYISSLNSDDPRVRTGLWSLGCRGYNVKLLKLHGSMNWLQCPNCQRMFVEFGSKQEILERIGETPCRHCHKFGYSNFLTGSLVMPTFLKDLSNFQIKLVWQNASVELMEAQQLVFIGYSLPQADFEFRQLLSRMVHKKASIDVVLYEGSTEEQKRQYRAEEERYRQFFGRRTMRFHSKGVGDFVSKLVSGATALGSSS